MNLIKNYKYNYSKKQQELLLDSITKNLNNLLFEYLNIHTEIACLQLLEQDKKFKKDFKNGKVDGLQIDYQFKRYLEDPSKHDNFMSAVFGTAYDVNTNKPLFPFAIKLEIFSPFYENEQEYLKQIFLHKQNQLADTVQQQ